MSITNQSTSKEGAEVVCTWGCKCVVVTNSAGATAYVDSAYFAAENDNVICDLNSQCDDEAGSRTVVVAERNQKASTAEVLRTH